MVILGPAHPLRGGGMATFNERLARAFMEMGHEVSIYSFSLQYPGFLFPGKSQYTDEPPPPGINIITAVNSINPINWRTTGRELKNLKPDLLVVRYWLPFMAPCLGTIASITKKNKHTRVVAITDNVIPHEKRPFDKQLTKYFLKKADAFVTMSSSVGNDLLHFGVHKNRVFRCPHPLYDHFGEIADKKEARDFLKIDTDHKLVLFFGFIREYKGLDLLIKAFAEPEMRDLPVSLLVAGEFYTRAKMYLDLVEKYKLQDRVIWRTNFIPNDAVRYYFSAADLVAQPYKHATQSGVTQVAYHFDKPMLVTNVGGLPEMVNHRKAGYVVAPDSKAIAAAMVEFFSDAGMAEKLSKSVKEEKKRFSWQRMVDTLFQAAGNHG